MVRLDQLIEVFVKVRRATRAIAGRGGGETRVPALHAVGGGKGPNAPKCPAPPGMHTVRFVAQPDIQYGRDALPEGQHLHWSWPTDPETGQVFGEAEFKAHLGLGAAAEKDILLRVMWCLPDGREVPQPPVEVSAKFFFIGAINCIELHERSWSSLLAPPPAPPGVVPYVPTITPDTVVGLAIKIAEAGVAGGGAADAPQQQLHSARTQDAAAGSAGQQPVVWVVVDAEECTRCCRHVRMADNVVCDDCGRATHLECEGLKKVPKGNWLCSVCNPTPKQPRKRAPRPKPLGAWPPQHGGGLERGASGEVGRGRGGAGATVSRVVQSGWWRQPRGMHAFSCTLRLMKPGHVGFACMHAWGRPNTRAGLREAPVPCPWQSETLCTA